MPAIVARSRTLMDRLLVSELDRARIDQGRVGALDSLCDQADRLLDRGQDATHLLAEIEGSIARLERLAGADTRETLRRIRRHWAG